jgi:hypothetical protein
MDADAKKMKKLARIMREQGILSYKTKDFEITVSPAALFPVEQLPNNQQSADHPIDSPVDPMEALLWSAPDFASHEELT